MAPATNKVPAPATPPTKLCGQCKYYHHYPSEPSDQGLCKANAPVPVTAACHRPADWPLADYPHVLWPVVHSGDTPCGGYA